MNIDMHHHFIPEELIAYMEEHPEETGAQVVREDRQTMIRFRQGWKIPVDPGQFDMQVRGREMERMRLDAVALSVAPVCFFYWVEAETAAETSRLCNDWAAGQAKKHPNVYPMATLPMQNVPMVLAELKRAHEKLDMRAVEIAPVIEGVLLDDSRFDPIYQYCNDHGILLYLHPQVMEMRPEYRNYYNTNLIGNVLETCIGLNHMLFGGVFERFPELRVLASHGGGYFPYQFGRLIHGHKVRPEPKRKLEQPPAGGLKNIYFDTITHWLPSLQFLVDTFGADHVVIGTDYPFDMGDLSPMSLVDQLRLTQEQRDAVCWRNALRLLGGEAPKAI